MYHYENIPKKDYMLVDGESLGGKDKFWLRDDSDIRWLFKIGRDDHENWSEVLAADICESLQIPHAEYKLAIYGEQKGVISKDFVNLSPQNETRDAIMRDSTYLLENFIDLHGQNIAAYLPGLVQQKIEELATNKKEMIRAMRHIEIALFIVWAYKEEAMNNADFLIYDPNPSESDYSPLHYFVGYLMLDTLIANRDRHQENWGYIEVSSEGKRRYFAPTYDHASSFIKESDEKKEALMANREGFSLQDFCRRARTRFVNFTGTKLTTMQVFTFVNMYFPQEVKYWKDRLRRCSMEKVFIPLVRRFPDEVMSPMTKKFVIEMLRFNRDRILYL